MKETIIEVKGDNTMTTAEYIKELVNDKLKGYLRIVDIAPETMSDGELLDYIITLIKEDIKE